MPSQWTKLAVAAGVTLAALGGVVLPAASPAMSRTADQVPPDPRGEFERLRQRQADAWARQDGAAFAATFTRDGDMVTFNGDHLRTRRGIAVGMQYYFDKYIPDSTIRYLGERVRFPAPGLAVIVRTTCLVDAGQSDCRDGSLSVNTNVMTRQRDGRWLQDSFQNTRVDPLP
ncbi:SgcJ/EcaC family oxidoreductase [Actinomadura kijaniata]|uniref:SgcJ/EcaC family oxidoreductase n=1 Tax=Actinomadura kijaniata TaxID=46161 RepID=UPI003F195691